MLSIPVQRYCTLRHGSPLPTSCARCCSWGAWRTSPTSFAGCRGGGSWTRRCLGESVVEGIHNGLHLNHGWVSQWCLWSGRSKRGALWLTFWDWRIGRFCEFHGSGFPGDRSVWRLMAKGSPMPSPQFGGRPGFSSAAMWMMRAYRFLLTGACGAHHRSAGCFTTALERSAPGDGRRRLTLSTF